MSLAVFTEHPAYLAQLAALTQSATRATGPLGALVALDGGDGWPARALAALDAGAVAIVVDSPRVPRLDLAEGDAFADLDTLAARAARLGIPVILNRPRLPHDLSAEGEPDVRAVLIECAAAPHEQVEVLADALGWARTLTASGDEGDERDEGLGALEVLAAETLPRPSGAAQPRDDEGAAHGVEAIAALLGTTQNVSVTVSFTGRTASLSEGATGEWIRATALGEIRTHVTVDLAAGPIEIHTVTVDGTLSSPSRHESPHRSALRRAIGALDQPAPTQPAPSQSAPTPPAPTQPAHDAPPTDLADFRHDAGLAIRLVSRPAPARSRA